MNTVTSADGTTIGYDRDAERPGETPAVVFVDGALSARGSKADLAGLLAGDFTVYRYDRRGRGDSGDTAPYAVGREVEDLAAVIEAAGGAAMLYGHSSGCALVIEAALTLGPAVVPKIALYEAPFTDDPGLQQEWKAYTEKVAQILAEGRRGDAIALFMDHIGMPGEQVAQLRQAPFFPALEAVAPTLLYDHNGLLGQTSGTPAAKTTRITVPALVMYGEASFGIMAPAARTLAAQFPDATLRSLPGQNHSVEAAVLAPVLSEFFAG